MNNYDTRSQIIVAADKLFYEQGYMHTSFAHIADKVNISRGNFYYHFRSKDDILEAVIKHRLDKTELMLEDWFRHGETPMQRVSSFAHILITNQQPILKFGCPVGTLTSELAKLNHQAASEANQIFTLFKDWLTAQFKQFNRPELAEQRALHLLARSQGIATLGHAFNDPEFINQEVKLIEQWLEEIE